MAQQLIQPVNDMTVTASYRWGGAYRARFGSDHYGQDVVGSTTVYAQGSGRVLFAGCDRVCGYVVGILYDEVQNHFDGGSYPVVGRYFHLAGAQVQPGQRVDKDTVIGIMGDIGALTTGRHLHIELDRDTAYPAYTPTLTGDSNILKAGLRGAKDTTLDPMRLTHCKTSGPDNQRCAVGDGIAWVDPRDGAIPRIR
ncbi:M23 family metallopeptidase [Neobittarella massiliensis]|uniref:M23 family metallopeptidase n=1 Tax=Neobittarella massiliensis (ex Bilen et al. 2018) TaxID=2041842 RepID=A0A8J6IEX7_9FIRM|nr:M23 family metallopeptidase [Neobittarella massiliensis]MBC3515915.1 M23 family metallopeptidase [Neobittarella massiliensis]